MQKHAFSQSDYEDIIHLPHHVSKTHPHMPAQDRAAQFAPFAAVSGHKEKVDETARAAAATQEVTAEPAEEAP